MRRWYVWLPISVGLLALVVWRTRPWEAAALASRLDLPPLLLAILLNGVVVVLWAVRSRSLMVAVGSPLPTVDLIPVTSFANTVNNITPASSGEVLRAWILKRRWAVPYARSSAVILAERLWAIGMMLVTAIAAAVGTLVDAPPTITILAWVAAVVACFAPSIAYAIGLRPGRLLARIAGPDPGHPGRVRRLAGHLAAVDERLASVLTRAGPSIHFVVTTALIFLCFALQLWLVLVALDAAVSPVATWAVFGLATCAGVLSALPFGLGATDLVIVVLLGGLGVDSATAGAAALILRLVTTLPLGILGAISWGLLNRGPDHVPASVSAQMTDEVLRQPDHRPPDDPGGGPPPSLSDRTEQPS